MAKAAPAASAAAIPGGLDGLIDAATELAELLTRETALVRAMRIGEIAPLQEAKRRLTRTFQEALRLLAAPDAPAMAPSLRLQWLTAGRRLAEAAAENERALRVGTVATERLIASIVAAFKERRPATAGYTPRRAAPRDAAVAGIALDRRL